MILTGGNLGRSGILTGGRLSRAVIAAGSGFSLLAHAGAGGIDNTTATTSAINTTGAGLIVLVVSYYHPAAPTVSDSKANSWTLAATGGNTSDASVKCAIYYCALPTVGSGHTFTASGTVKAPAICALAFSGGIASPLDQTNATTTGTSSTTVQAGSVTPSANNEVLVTGYAGYNGNVSSIDSSFTISDTVANAPGKCLATGAAYLIQTTAAAANPTWTLPSLNTNSAVIATFKSS